MGPPNDLQGHYRPFPEVLFEPAVRIALVRPTRAQRNVRHCWTTRKGQCSWFLTINSQPAVNGIRSDDKTFGWGPSNGYVYQKAYMEFFASPELLDALITHIERDPGIIYYVINKRGDLRTNLTSDGPNAVTWGVFPVRRLFSPQ